MLARKRSIYISQWRCFLLCFCLDWLDKIETLESMSVCNTRWSNSLDAKKDISAFAQCWCTVADFLQQFSKSLIFLKDLHFQYSALSTISVFWWGWLQRSDCLNVKLRILILVYVNAYRGCLERIMSVDKNNIDLLSLRIVAIRVENSFLYWFSWQK